MQMSTILAKLGSLNLILYISLATAMMAKKFLRMQIATNLTRLIIGMNFRINLSKQLWRNRKFMLQDI